MARMTLLDDGEEVEREGDRDMESPFEEDRSAAVFRRRIWRSGPHRNSRSVRTISWAPFQGCLRYTSQICLPPLVYATMGQCQAPANAS